MPTIANGSNVRVATILFTDLDCLFILYHRADYSATGHVFHFDRLSLTPGFFGLTGSGDFEITGVVLDTNQIAALDDLLLLQE